MTDRQETEHQQINVINYPDGRHRLMEIDSHILSLSMEFEKQNIIITEWETEKAKSKSDQISAKRKKKKMRRRQPKIYLEASRDNDYEDDGAEDDDVNDDNESGFEVQIV